jgi:hypothetical protein
MFLHCRLALICPVLSASLAYSGEPNLSLQDQLSKEPILALAKAARDRGDAARGALLFFQPFLTCAKCHDSEGGTQLGPDIAKVGKDGTAEYLIESVLYPSKVVKKGYETIIITTSDGRVLQGLVAE